MVQFLRYFIALFFSLFLHLEILQLRFTSAPSQPAPGGTIELALVSFSPAQQDAPGLASRAEATHEPARASAAPAGKTEAPDPAARETAPEPRPVRVDAAEGELAAAQAGGGPVADERLQRKQRPAGKPEPEASVAAAGKALAPDRSTGVAAERSEPEADNPVAEPTTAAAAVPPQPVAPAAARHPAGSEVGRPAAPSGGRAAPASVAVNAGTPDVQQALPRYEVNPRPVYPDIALRKGWEGRVLLRVDVKKNGSVGRVAIEHSSGFSALDRAALKAVRRWQFVPAMAAGFPTAGAAVVPINFDIP